MSEFLISIGQPVDSNGQANGLPFKQRTGQLRRIIEVGTSLQQNRDVDSLLKEIVDSARLSLGFNVITLNLHEPETNRMVTRAFAGLDDEGQKLLLETDYSFNSLKVLMQERFRVGRCYFIPAGALDWDVEFTAPTYNPVKDAPKAGTMHDWQPDDALFVPVETIGPEGKFYGLLWADQPNDGRRPGQNTYELMEYYAAQAAVALENTRLLGDMRIAADRLAVLHQVSQEIVRVGQDAEKIYLAIHQSAARLLCSDAFVINLVNETRTVIKAVYMVDNNQRVYPGEIGIGEGMSGYVIARDESLLIRDLLSDELPTRPVHVGPNAPMRSLVMVPMRLGEKVTGTLSVQSYLANMYTADDVKLLEMFAAYAAIALDNARLFNRLQQLAITDSLTSLFNRRHLIDKGTEEFLRAKRYQHPFTALILDLDHFKEINDNLGHQSGDQVLTELAQLLRLETRRSDILGRYGGEEFAVLLVETGLNEAWEAADRIRLAIASWEFEAGGSQVRLTTSIGLAGLDGSVNDFDELLKRADQALYEAKRAGRNRIIAYGK